MRQAGATLHRGARASHYRGLSCRGAQAPDAQAQQLWLTGPVTPQHVGSSQTRARTRVPCIGRQTLNHCATREALAVVLKGTARAPAVPSTSLRRDCSTWQALQTAYTYTVHSFYKLRNQEPVRFSNLPKAILRSWY